MEFKILLSLLQKKRFLKTWAIHPTTTTTTTCQNPSSSSSSSSSSFTVDFLVNSCGVPLEVALSASKTLQLDRKNNAQNSQSVRSFLKSHKFDDTQIAKLISNHPSILQSKIRTNPSPKYQFLIENGFSGELLPELIMSNSRILFRSLGSQIKPSYEILKKYLKTQERVAASVKRSSWLLTSNLDAKLVPNMELLVREGVSDKVAAQFLLSQPRMLMKKEGRMALCIETVKQLGLQPGHSMYAEAVRVKASISDSTWNNKVRVFKDLGWSEEDIVYDFIRYPSCLACSEMKIRRMVDFYTKTTKLELEDIISSPKLINYSLERRIRPRYQVLKVLVSKGLIKHYNKPLRVFHQSETAFLDNFVFKYAGEVPKLLEMYNAAKPKAI